MRGRSRTALAVTAACACVAGPALATIATGGAAPAAAALPTSPQTIPMTTTVTIPTGTATTGTTTAATQTTTTPAKPQDVCMAKARRAVAGGLGVSTAKVAVASGEGTNGMPQCGYIVQRPRNKSLPHTSVHLVVNVDTAPQASWRLMRKVVEATQIFGTPPPGWHAPIGLYGLGQYASWFINLHSLMCVNKTRTRLLTVEVSWKQADRGQMIKLARQTVEPYIHAPAKVVPIPNEGF